MIKVIVDGFGGDNSPEEIVKGAVLCVTKNEGFNVILTGNAEKIAELLLKNNYSGDRIEIINSTEVITNNDVPTLAIRQKADSSLVVALKKLKEDDEVVGLVSAGSTGAVLAGGLLKVGRIKGISRPALCPILPTINDNKSVLLVDCGANVDCKPINLVHFAIMGSSYMTSMFGTEKPRIGLLSNGTEDKKGNELNHQVFPMLKSLNCINFIGNIEAREILSGDVDVVVTDGFVGNIALKGIEGAISSMLKMIKKGVMSSLRYKIGAVFLKPMFKKLRAKLDYNNHGGAVFLGVEKIIVKAHGSSKDESINCSIMQVVEASKTNLTDSIKNKLEKVDLSAFKI